jgi:sulfide dehydrogenase cytochrome subunit
MHLAWPCQRHRRRDERREILQQEQKGEKMKIYLLGMSSAIALAGLAASTSAFAANGDDGRVLAAQCSQCHGTDTNSASGFNTIAGKGDLYQRLITMKYRAVPGGIMDLEARGYSDAQLRMIADYLAAQQAATSTTTRPAKTR